MLTMGEIVGSMYNGSWRTVYNPTSFWEKYR